MPTALRRQDITFEDKDQPLRDDVRTLGGLVGELLKEQGGKNLFDFVENARLQSIRRREGNEKPGEKLEDLFDNLDLKFTLEVIRSFSTYFQMVNTAEKVHRIRRRREYLQEEGKYQPGGLEETLVKLKAGGVDLPRLQALLDSIDDGLLIVDRQGRLDVRLADVDESDVAGLETARESLGIDGEKRSHLRFFPAGLSGQ